MKFKQIFSVIFVIAFLSSLLWFIKVSHEPNQEIFTESFLSLSTVVQIKLATTVQMFADSAFQIAKQKIIDLELIFSDYQPSAEVFKINASAGVDTFKIKSAQLIDVLQLSDCLYNRTDGLFEPTIGALKKLWNFESGRTIPPTQDSINTVLHLVGWDMVYFNEDRIFLPKVGMALDLGAIAKGYIIQTLKDTLCKLDFISAGLVEIGGDIACWGLKPTGDKWTIGIRHPREPGEIISQVKLRDMAITTSGDYERTFTYDNKRYHHILNPKTGYPTETFSSVSVITNDATLADALATAIYLVGWDKGIAIAEELAKAEVMAVTLEGETYKTDGFDKFITDK
jgi:FAD:protein FMN transferase